MLQIAIIEDEADLAQQTKDNVVRYLNEHGLEGNRSHSIYFSYSRNTSGHLSTSTMHWNFNLSM